jgi:hypothetical protein
MAVNDWLPVATTALGGLLAAGGGWLSQWAGSRGSEKRVREERRHSAYGAFIAASKELPVLAQEAYNSADTEEQRPWLDEVTTLARTITRTSVDVTLAGPRGATEAAEAVQRKAWKIVSILDPRMGADDEEFDVELDKYLSRCVQFEAVAQATLHTAD